MAKRQVDKRKTSKALRKLRRAAALATGEGGPGLTRWEEDFVSGVSGRLEKYGSAFRDPGKGRLDEALSARQMQVTRAIAGKSRKARPSGAESPAKPNVPRSGLVRKTPLRARPKASQGPRVRDINDDPEPPSPASPDTARAVRRRIRDRPES